jgi:GT2 family glycosyltransferase
VQQEQNQMAHRPKLSIMIPTWNNLSMLRLCLDSISRHSEYEHQIILHINEGSDGTLDWTRSNNIEYTYSSENIGICSALNLAATQCASDYLVYLNDDMYVLPGWDRAMLDCIQNADGREPAYVSGTIVQSTQFSPSNIIGDYGADLTTFDESGLLRDFHKGKLCREDWNGATWPPCCIHRKWWDAVGGYSEELSPGFYSDIDFSMKLWKLGCRRFHGVGSSLVYHFGEKTTSQVRGPKSIKVKEARIRFLKKWGILPSTFSRYFVHAGKCYQESTPEPRCLEYQIEKARLWVLSALYNIPRIPAYEPQTLHDREAHSEFGSAAIVVAD